jgi:hypothetical protein
LVLSTRTVSLLIWCVGGHGKICKQSGGQQPHADRGGEHEEKMSRLEGDLPKLCA